MTALPEGVVAVTHALAEGRTTARAAVETYLERIAATNGRLNTFIKVLDEEARRQADDSDARRKSGRSYGPLDGMPIAIKDNIDIAGVTTTAGIGHYRNSIAVKDAFVVQRIRAAGMPILGKLNMHEAALGATNDNPWFGRCENPRKAGYTPGGSSGGSGAAVAAGLCPVALGTDTLGSVRVPASYCGTAGFKPTYGLISTRGVVPLSWTLDHVGPLAPTSADIVAVMKCLACFDNEWPWSRPALERVPAAPGQFRLGVPRELTAVSIESAVADAFQAVLARLGKGGFDVKEVSLRGYDFTAMRREGLLVAEVESALHHAQALAADPAGFSNELQSLLNYGGRQPAMRIAEAYRRLVQAKLAAREAFSQVDILVMPTTPQPAFAFGEPVPVNQADLTGFANIVGCPAACLPMGTTADGLPLSVQFIAPEFNDQLALAVAQAFEALP